MDHELKRMDLSYLLTLYEFKTKNFKRLYTLPTFSKELFCNVNEHKKTVDESNLSNLRSA